MPPFLVPVVRFRIVLSRTGGLLSKVRPASLGKFPRKFLFPVMGKSRGVIESHLGVHDGLDRRFKLLRVVIVDSPHVRLANEVLCIGMLGEHLPATNGWLLQPAAGLGSRTHPDPFPLCTPTLGPPSQVPRSGPSAHLPGGGLAPEELVVEGAVGRAEARLKEDAAVGDGLQGCWALVGESEPYKELEAEGRQNGSTGKGTCHQT